MENLDQNLEYALSAIQKPQLRETEEFHQWISVPEKIIHQIDCHLTDDALH